MRSLVLVLVLLIGCGSNPPPPAPAPIANAAAPDAGVAVAPIDAHSWTTPTASCCSSGMWICEGGEIPHGSACGGDTTCCQGGVWTCGRLPRPGECPGSGLFGP